MDGVDKPMSTVKKSKKRQNPHVYKTFDVGELPEKVEKVVSPEKAALIQKHKDWREWIRANRPDQEKMIVEYNRLVDRKREQFNRWKEETGNDDLHAMIKEVQYNRPEEEKPIVKPTDREMDVIITSASRPEMIQQVESFQEKIIFSGKFNMYLHEDVVPGMEQGSRKLVNYANDCGLFTKIIVSNPRVGRGNALNKLKQYIKTRYIFYMEEDFEYMRYINIDRLIDLMDIHKKINQIAFANRYWPLIDKPAGPRGAKFYFYEPRQFDEIILQVSERWLWYPAIWRKKFIWEYWNFSSHRAAHDLNRRIKNNDGQFKKHFEWDCKWLEKKLGAYLLDGSSDKDPWVNAWTYHLCPHLRHDRSFL